MSETRFGLFGEAQLPSAFGDSPLDPDSLMIFAGSSSAGLVDDVCASLGVPPGRATVSRFRDGEVNIEINDSVRGKDIFIINSTCRPANENLVELIIMMDAVRRASAARITAVIPYFGYARQDRRPRSVRVPISAKVVANMISTAGAHRALTVDLHADQIQGFFDIPVDNIYASPILIGDIWRRELTNPIVVSPDVGGVVRARAIAKQLDDAELAIIDKRRPRANEAQVMNIIGEVKGRTCVIVDDIADTAGTLCQGARALKQRGAERVFAYCTHAVLSEPAAPGARRLIPTGLVLGLPTGYEAQIRPRSGLAFRQGLTVLNAPGTIDSDYRGEVKLLLANLGDEPVDIERGERLAQMVVAAVPEIRFQEDDSLGRRPTEGGRNDGGFGSTGT